MAPEIKALILILVGLLFCFAGYKVQKFLVTLIWFVIGFEIGVLIGPKFIANNDMLLIVEVVAGFILASLGYKLEKIALFVTVAYLTYITIGPFIKGFEGSMNFMIQAGISLLMGALAIILIKPILTIVTGISGAGIINEFLPVIVNISSQTCLIVAAVIAVVGIFVQFKTN